METLTLLHFKATSLILQQILSMYKQLHDEDDDRAPPAKAIANNTVHPSKHIVMNDDESIIDDLECHVNNDIHVCLQVQHSSGDTQRSVDDLFGLDEDSSVLAKLIILNRQSCPVIVTLVFYLGGDVINFLFAGRYIPSDNNSQILAGIINYCTTMHVVLLPMYRLCLCTYMYVNVIRHQFGHSIRECDRLLTY